MAKPKPGAADSSQVSAQISRVLLNLLAEQRPGLAMHLEAVARLAEAVATRLALPPAEREPVICAAYLHDVGKLAIPERILAKAGPLDAPEVELIRRHTIVGAEILAAVGLDQLTVSFVRASHERIDGTGYPDGLAAEEIPLGARIIAVCDAYEAMASPRPYRTKPLSVQAACRELVSCAGTQFDPTVVAATTRMVLAVAGNGDSEWSTSP